VPRPEDLLRLAGVGRFQVMALLQAARYHLLRGGGLEEAKSWGLNRAIFYAWAKHYGPRHRRRAATLQELERLAARRRPGRRCPEGMEEVLGECVERGPRGWFAVGGEEQTPRGFDRQVASRVSKLIPWERAWEAALHYLERFPRRVLEDPQLFYRYVYEPVRDRFFLELLEGKQPEPPRWVAERVEKLRGGGEGGGLDRWLSGAPQGG